MPQSLIFPVASHVPRHELVVGEGDVFVPQGGHHLPGVRAPVGPVQLEPARGRGGGHQASWPGIEAVIAAQGPGHWLQVSPHSHSEKDRSLLHSTQFNSRNLLL